MNGRALVGLGGKDGIYYALDRATGKLVWKTTASAPASSRRTTRPAASSARPRSTTASSSAVPPSVARARACTGSAPTTGTIAWQQSEAAPTFAPSAIVNGVAFSGSTTDFTLRALDLRTGKVLWSQQLAGGIAGGVAVSGDLVVAVAGIREPGHRSGRHRLRRVRLHARARGATTTTAAPQGTLPPTSAAPPPTTPDPNAPSGPDCIGRPCTVSFTLKAPPAGTNPSMTIHLRPQPFRIEVRADDLGDPNAWLRAGSPTATRAPSPTACSASDDALKGSLLCVLDASFDCVSEVVPSNPSASYNRISILAIANTPELPAASEGFDRLVTTVALDHPVSFK